MKLNVDSINPTTAALTTLALVVGTTAAFSLFGGGVRGKKAKDPKVILITGASSGMGKDFALRLRERGHVVYGAARRIEKMKDLEAVGCKTIQMDVSKDDQIVKCCKTIIDNEGKIDVLINNAGYAIYGPVETVTMESARKEMDVCVFGLARMTKEVIPHMRKQQSGLIINTSSMGGKIYFPLGAWYHAAKHAVEGFSDCLRFELKKFGIKVVILEPGLINTEFASVMMDPLVKTCKDTPYEPLANALSGMESSGMSHVSVITNRVIMAVEQKNPPKRILAGAMARPMVFIRNTFGDGIYERILDTMMGG